MILVVDLHALSDDKWRGFMIGVSSWDEYHEASRHDEPVKEVIGLVNSMKNSGHTVIGFSARPEKWRKLTNEWLLRNRVELSELMMRDSDDFRPSMEIRRDMVRSLSVVDFVIDDREDVCREFSELRIPTLQVRR